MHQRRARIQNVKQSPYRMILLVARGWDARTYPPLPSALLKRGLLSSSCEQLYAPYPVLRRSTTRHPARSTTRHPARSTTRRPARSVTRLPARSVTRHPARSVTRLPARSTTRHPARSVGGVAGSDSITLPVWRGCFLGAHHDEGGGVCGLRRGAECSSVAYNTW